MELSHRSDRERQALGEEYSRVKLIVVKWETAFTKSEEREPGKEDFETAPRKVREAYARYYEIKKDEERKRADGSRCKQSSEKKEITPKKIFVGRSAIESRNFKPFSSSSSSSHSNLPGVIEEDAEDEDEESVLRPFPKKPQPVHDESPVPKELEPVHEKDSSGSVPDTPEKSAEELDDFKYKDMFPKLYVAPGRARTSAVSAETRPVPTPHQPIPSRPLPFSRDIDGMPFPTLVLVNSSFESSPQSGLQGEDEGDEHDPFSTEILQSMVAAALNGPTSMTEESTVATFSTPTKVCTGLRRVDIGWLDRCTKDLLNDYEDMDTHSTNSGEVPLPEPEPTPTRSVMKDASPVEATPLQTRSVTEYSSPLEATPPKTISVTTSASQLEATPPRNTICLEKYALSLFEPTPPGTRSPNKDASTQEAASVQTRSVKKRLASPLPYPEKLEPKRKFFKSGRPELMRKHFYSSDSFAPVEKLPVSKKARVAPGSGKRVKPAPVSKKSSVEPANATKVNTNSGSVSRSLRSRLTSLKKKYGNAGSTGQSSGPGPVPKGNNSIPVQESDAYDEVMSADRNNGVKSKGRGKKPRLTSKEFLQKKVDTGRLNENFVRVDIGKKVFVRGRKRICGAKVKRNDWKMRRAAASKNSKIKLIKCAKCGDIGHHPKYCMSDSINATHAVGEPAVIDDSPFPTLQESARAVWSPSNRYILGTRIERRPGSKSKDKEGKETLVESGPVMSEDADSQSQSLISEIPSQSQASGSESQSEAVVSKAVEPAFKIGTYTPQEEASEIMEALQKFGHKNFRPGQQEAVTRVLQGLSTLVILSTGSGKSLCYLLPAYIYAQHHPGVITLCISPLVSLMEDQVQSIPAFVRSACLHTNMTEKQRENVLEKVRNKKLSILLVSPEAVCSGLFGLLRDENQFPPIAFACIDEVHCVSEWSHNFRPSYLKLCKILRDKLKVQTILGLTATATNHTVASVCEHLRVDPSSVIRGEIVPKNLRLSVSRDENREEALLNLLRGDRFVECNSIIIYCTRREECERIATMIRTHLQDTAYNGIEHINFRHKISTNSEAYHAGMSASKRKHVQNQFMSGNIRIVVATVAFGMGIDKSDIRAVIHYNMPKTFESYVQEIGRAGRDGLPAECHLFLDNVKGKDLAELKRHVYSNSIDRSTIRRLVKTIFKPCRCARMEKLKGAADSEHKECGGHEVSFSIEETVKDLDLPDENIETLLCYLELDTSRKWIEMLPKCYQMCLIQSYGGTRLLKRAANLCPPLGVAIALLKERKKLKDDAVNVKFNLVEAAATVGWNSATVRRELKHLEWTGTAFDDDGNPKEFRKSGIIVEFSDLAYRLIAPGCLTDEECDAVLNYLHGRNLSQERTQLYQLERVHRALDSVSVANVGLICDGFNEEKSDVLKSFIFAYFNENAVEMPQGWKPLPTGKENDDDIRRNVQVLLSTHVDVSFTGRSIAKIFQGIPSPCFPAYDWSRNRSFWRRHVDSDFNLLCQIASNEISSRK